MKTLLLEKIRVDGDTEPRAFVDDVLVKEYAESMAARAEFPPVVVFYDGNDYWLADGYHRYFAAESLELASISADVRQGTQHDAMIYSCGANAEHGSRRTTRDKERAVQRLLEDKQWGRKSSRQIAAAAKVSDHFVERVRRGQKPSSANGSHMGGSHPKVRQGGDGKWRPSSTGRSKGADSEEKTAEQRPVLRLLRPTTTPKHTPGYELAFSTLPKFTADELQSLRDEIDKLLLKSHNG